MSNKLKKLFTERNKGLKPFKSIYIILVHKFVQANQSQGSLSTHFLFL